MTERLASLEGGYDGLQHGQRILVATVCFGGGAIGIALLVAMGLMIYGYDAQSRRIERLEARIDSLSAGLSAKIDAVPDRIDRQFQTLQVQTAAQTSAIANSITAARQLTPPVVFQPTPQPPEPAPAAVAPPPIPPQPSLPQPSAPASSAHSSNAEETTTPPPSRPASRRR